MRQNAVARRTFLQFLSAAAGAFAAGGPVSALASALGSTAFGPPVPFSFDALAARARRRAGEVYGRPQAAHRPILERIDYDAHWRIRYRMDANLTPAAQSAPVQMFHLGRYFQTPVRIFVCADGEAREALYRNALFEMPGDSPAHALPDDAGFAGFRVMRPDGQPDWVSFLGASYFRADGPFMQYGLSARGIAIDTGLARAEEFPEFVEFWLAPPEDPADDMTVYGLLDGPSVTGAYRFGLRRGDAATGHRTSVSASLFFRSGVERFGVAPLTGMYWFSERRREGARDWRPEIHDVDGLAIATGAGERIWRGLRNPKGGMTSSFFDDNPKGFGLIQRDRSFENYQDDGAFYDKRPSAWVEPKGAWGRGAVQLIELPTGDETFDNIVAYWTPERQPAAGDAPTFDYVVHWTDRDPPAGDIARVAATYQGAGGAPGQPPRPGTGKLVIDFDGAALAGLDRDSGVEAMVSASNGAILEPVAARPVVGTSRWRLSFDFEHHGPNPVDIRAYLARNGAALTETWLGLAEV